MFVNGRDRPSIIHFGVINIKLIIRDFIIFKRYTRVKK